MRQRLAFFLIAGLACFVTKANIAAVHAQILPADFVHLREIDRSILQDMRLSGTRNFMGRRAAGINGADCILTRQAASALQRVQSRLLEKKLSLKVYDCYRPRQADRDLFAWAQAGGSTSAKALYYPTYEPKDLIKYGFITSKSGHASGSAVDATIVPLPVLPGQSAGKQCHGPFLTRRRDNSLDFGTAYHCFHEHSRTNHPAISQRAKTNRQFLASVMRREGFANDPNKWWHFNLTTAPRSGIQFDFQIGSASSPQPQRPKTNIRTNFNQPSRAKPQKLTDTGIGPTAPLDTAPVDKPLAGKLVCLQPSGHLNLRAGPGLTQPILARLRSSQTSLTLLGCQGSVTLAQWHLNAGARANDLTPPWCRVMVNNANHALKSATGWVSGEFIAPDDIEPYCK